MKRRDLLRAGVLGGLSFAALHCAHPVAPRATDRRGPTAVDPPVRATDPEALIRLLEDTERDRIIEVLAPEIRDGLESDQLVAALYAAATRNVLTLREFSTEQHILLCTHSARQASEVMPARLRWRPLLWAVDFFKWAQEAVAEYEPRPMEPLADGRVPGPDRALRELERAMEEFDGARAEAAIAGLHRSAPRELVIETLLRYGSKDFRHIGHKAIHVSNGLATLDVTGWHRAEQVLRSIAATLALHYEEEGRDHDGSWISNQALAPTLPAGWATGRPSDEAVRSLITTLREADPDRASAEIARWSMLGVGPRSLWDAMLLSSAELLLDNPASVEALHAVTASNAAYAAFERARDDSSRRLLLLQNAARVADFHGYVAYWSARRKSRPMFDVRIEELEALPVPASAEQAIEEIFAALGQSPDASMRAVRSTLGLLESHAGAAEQVLARALEIIASRATDSHDFKLAVALMEDLPRLSPQWRARYLAACVVRLRGSTEPTIELAQRCEALRL